MTEKLTQAERKDLKEKLLLIAEMYFSGDHELITTCGICCALDNAFEDNSKCYYHIMDKMLLEFTGTLSVGEYTNTFEEWEGRAYLCLFFAEYLDSTIELKSSEILRKARVIMNDGSTLKDGIAWDKNPSPYICDNLSAVAECNSLEITSKKVYDIKDKISELINHEFSLEDWLILNGHATQAEIYSNPAKMQQTRYNMIDDLIQFYESAGD